MKKSNVFIVLFLLLQTCATKKIYLPESNNKIIENSQKKVVHTFYLIGDAGDENGNTLQQIKLQLDSANTKSTVLFLGDNIYPKGLPENSSSDREQAEDRLNKQIESVKNFAGKTIFIPGNHDWYSDGVTGLKRQEKYVEDNLGKNTFLPENGCPIEKVEIGDDIVLLIVDSHWYITNWNKHPTINDDCEIKTRAMFLDEFRSEIKKARGKTTLVAIHHPMYTFGPHGAQYSFSDFMKPLPILGNLKNIIRSTSGISNADMSNYFYNDLRQNLIAVAQQNDKVIFLSGHEHSLQYIESDNIPQIVSGSGSKTTAVNVKGKNNFGAGIDGYAILNVFDDKSSEVTFIRSDLNDVIYKKQIYGPSLTSDRAYPNQFNETEKVSIYSKEETTKSSFYKFLWGDRFRDHYSTVVEAPIVTLDTLHGGLNPIRKGGGTQSKSLHLQDAEGKRYVMRAMKKQAVQFIQSAILPDQNVIGQFNDTASEDLIEDVFTGSYPYAPLIVANMSDALKIYHLNPKLFYVPKHSALGQYNLDFGDELYIIEEHPSDGHDQLAPNGFTGKIISTMDVLKSIHKDESMAVDQKEFIKVRLFDILIGDADRHQDQWRWMEFEEKGKKVYKPLARDRDLSFSKMSDGFLFGAAVALMPAARKFRKYEPDLKDVNGFNLSGYPLDMAFLTDIGKDVWDEQVKFLQDYLTDDVINTAFSEIPKELDQEEIEEIKRILIQRRENLPLIADRYYNLVIKYAVITATNKDDYIRVDASENGMVDVALYRKKDDTIKDRFHHRTYDPKKTKEIWIYGLDDDDSFEVIGKSKRIKIRLIGGQNKDNYKIANGKNIVVYDYKSKSNDLSEAKNARVKLSDDYGINVYDYKKLKSNTNQIFPLVGANPDDGFKMGIIDTYTVYGFERNPFTSQHKIGAGYYFATNGYELSYSGEFANVIKNFNFIANISFQGPNFSQNFFGYGNETNNNDDDLGLDYNRVKIKQLEVAPRLVWDSKRGSKIGFGFGYKSIKVDETENRFIENNITIPNYLFNTTQFIDVNANYEFINYDNRAYPTMGMLFNIETGYVSNLDQEKGYSFLTSKWGLAHKLIPSGKLVLGTILNGHLNFGNDFEFFQAASIGGTNGLRGYRNQRFSGKRSFYQNTDLRYSFNKIKTPLLPIKIGVYGSFDYGRVWTSNLDYSEKWHNSFGGGLFVSGVDLISCNIGAFHSNDGMRIAFALGFGF